MQHFHSSVIKEKTQNQNQHGQRAIGKRKYCETAQFISTGVELKRGRPVDPFKDRGEEVNSIPSQDVYEFMNFALANINPIEL